jgi:hypothetical protein
MAKTIANKISPKAVIQKLKDAMLLVVCFSSVILVVTGSPELYLRTLVLVRTLYKESSFMGIASVTASALILLALAGIGLFKRVPPYKVARKLKK